MNGEDRGLRIADGGALLPFSILCSPSSLGAPPCAWPPVGIVETLAWLSWCYGVEVNGEEAR